MKPLTKETAQILRPVEVHKHDRMHVALDREGRFFIVKFYAVREQDDRHDGPSYMVDKFVERFAEKKALDGWPPRYEIGATDWSATIINLWPASQMQIDDDARMTLTFLLLTNAAQEQAAEVYARFKDLQENPRWVAGPGHMARVNLPLPKEITDGTYEDHPDWPLEDYQKVALHNAMGSDGYALFMEQGTGKTPVVIARVCNEAKRLRNGHLDWTAVKRTKAQIEARRASAITHGCAQIDEQCKEAIERAKRERINDARDKAGRMQVEMNYQGSADGALATAERVVRDAKQWLASQLARIELEMVPVADQIHAKFEVKKQELIDSVNRDADIKIAGLRPREVKGESRMYRAIIVCPNNVRLNWQYEFFKFATQQGKITIIRGGEVVRTKQLIDAMTPDDDDDLYTVVVISYDTAKAHWDKGLNLIPWDLAVLDESHYIKWPETQRHQVSMKIRDKASARMPLTGTPITNTGLDLYAQFEFCREGGSGFGWWKNFRTFYGVYKPTSEGREALVGLQNLPFIQERLARMSFAVDKADVLKQLPKKQYEVREVQMGAKQTKVYAEIRDQLAVEIEDMLEDETRNRSLVVRNVLTKLLRLAQITSGHVKWDPVCGDDGEELEPGWIEHFTPNPKVQELVEIVKNEKPNSKVLVWACWVEDIKAIQAGLTEAGIDHVTYYGGTSEKARSEAVERFNKDPNCRVFIGNPAAGGTGLNLVGFDPSNPDDYDTNCEVVAYFSQGWSAVHRSQSEDRAHRRITRKPVRYIDLMVAGTIDEEIRNRVTMKRLTASSIADIRDILANVLKTKVEDYND